MPDDIQLGDHVALSERGVMFFKRLMAAMNPVVARSKSAVMLEGEGRNVDIPHDFLRKVDRAPMQDLPVFFRYNNKPPGNAAVYMQDPDNPQNGIHILSGESYHVEHAVRERIRFGDIPIGYRFDCMAWNETVKRAFSLPEIEMVERPLADEWKAKLESKQFEVEEEQKRNIRQGELLAKLQDEIKELEKKCSGTPDPEQIRQLEAVVSDLENANQELRREIAKLEGEAEIQVTDSAAQKFTKRMANLVRNRRLIAVKEIKKALPKRES